MKLFEDILWKVKCPTDIEVIAAHFVDNYVPENHFRTLDFSAAFIPWQDPWFAYRRMLGSIYGIAACYKPPDDSPSKPGWNRKLRNKHPNLHTDELVEKVFLEVLAILKELDNQTTRPNHTNAVRQA